MSVVERENLKDKIKRLERELQDAKIKLDKVAADDETNIAPTPSEDFLPAHLHSLLLLSDSALPLGSFAFSSGLESFLAHRPKRLHDANSLIRFLDLSVTSIAASTLSYVVVAHNQPQRLVRLDNDLDASTTCAVAKRASVKQGRALITIWERSFRVLLSTSGTNPALVALQEFSALLKHAPVAQTESFGVFGAQGHLPPLFGVTCKAMDIPLKQSLYLYLFNHAKTVLSAGIRSSVVGPYQAQSILSSEKLRETIETLVRNELKQFELDSNDTFTSGSIYRAGQHVPSLDLWGGRHEIVYSRVFNS